MSDNETLNEHGNHEGEFSQGVGGWAEYTVHMTETADTARHDVTLPPGKVIPIIFLPGVMGSNLRMSKKRQRKLDRPDNRAWKPDDMVTLAGALDVVGGSGIGNWFKNATPAQRQLVFDQTETEVEYYHYTESKGRFDPEGKETLEADARHQNVPDSFLPIPPLMGRLGPVAAPLDARGRPRKFETAAQVARWRGWSEVLFKGAYGQMLCEAERCMNNMFKKNGQLHPFWQTENSPMRDPTMFGATSGTKITADDLKKISACWYPVHAMGYNFLRSNGDSAKTIAERIRGLVKGYKHRGFNCVEVIIVTHSMGGLLARALIHPKYGNLLEDKALKVLGIYHGAMPTLGAAGAYKRMRFGFQEAEGNIAEMQAKIFGINGEHATAILANAPAPLEMMPGLGYGTEWLKVVDARGKVLMSWPKKNTTALDDIYLQPEKSWWRLLNPKWVNPARVADENGGGLINVHSRIASANKFLESIETTFHTTTYASYCASPTRRSYGDVVFRLEGSEGSGIDYVGKPALPFPDTWTSLNDDAKGRLTVLAGTHRLTLTLLKAGGAGDETVPSDRSAKRIVGTHFIHGESGPGYEHQNSYADPQVLSSMLYSLVQIAKLAQWTKS